MKRCRACLQKSIASFLLFIISGYFGCVNHDIEYSPCVRFNIPGAYQYPIPFQSDAWFELRTLEERVSACQIPQAVLDTISTAALLETLLNYPLLFEYAAFDIMQNGFERIKGEQKGFAAFYSRSDAFEVALARYNNMHVRCDGVYPPFPKDLATPASVALMHVEFMLFQDEFIKVLNEGETRILFQAVFRKLELKNQHNDMYQEYGKWLSCAVLGKIMFENNFEAFKEYCDKEPFVEFFIHRVPVYRPENLDVTAQIFRFARQYMDALG
jgi:hypothetical protein